MEYEDIRVRKQGHVATVEVDRPKVMNAIRYATMLEIRDAMENIESDDAIRVMVITGAGDKAFISGGDISIMAGGAGYAGTLREVPRGQAICSEIENFPKPVIARINGPALGGGTEIAMCCDIRIAVETAVMGLPEIKLGIIPGYGGTQRLPRLIGMGKAKELIFTGDHITASEALRVGLVNRVVTATDLDAEVAALCLRLSAVGPLALHMAKTAMNNGTQADLRTGLDLEARCFSLTFGTEDRREGMKAFMEKREARFKGR
jgi:enoyl-CoA hydratase